MRKRSRRHGCKSFSQTMIIEWRFLRESTKTVKKTAHDRTKRSVRSTVFESPTPRRECDPHSGADRDPPEACDHELHRNPRTAVGARDQAEVARLVDWFGKS